jgi:serpin B
MGMPIVFDLDRADLFDIAEPSAQEPRFALSGIYHKAFVKVDEQGTEAAAATIVGIHTLSLAPRVEPPKVFRADHPFLFLIRDLRNGSILFLGRVASP